jgi:hypothetical protein
MNFRLVFTLPLFLVLAGCGGGANPTPSTNGPVTIEATLSNNDFFDVNDDRYYDIYVCEPTESGTASVEMRSFEVDSQLYIYRRDGSGDYDLIEQNDDFLGVMRAWNFKSRAAN